MGGGMKEDYFAAYFEGTAIQILQITSMLKCTK